MKKVMSLLVGLAFIVGLAGAFGHAVPEALAASKKKLKVEIGETASRAQKTRKHDIKIEALEEGRLEYVVRDRRGDEYKIKLTEEQVKDILDGTTVMVETEGGMMEVKITAKEEKKKRSGW